MAVILLGGGRQQILPFAVSGLQGWWKADAGVYKDAGVTLAADTETCQQWNDQSGNGRHFSQAVAGSRPLYLTNQVNGQPLLRFDSASTDYMSTSSAMSAFIANNAHTMFIVPKLTLNATDDGAQPANNATILGASNNYTSLYFRSSANKINFFNYDSLDPI